MASRRAYIVCCSTRQNGLYAPWLDRLSIPWQEVCEDIHAWEAPDDAAIVISHRHYGWEEIHALRRVYERNRVPVLILADGILEYRNIFEHPDLADGCLFQPVFGHKLACIGRGQCRVVESWGNVGKCESVGLPRLDRLFEQEPTPIQKSGPFRLLIATASTPAFNSAQRAAVLESLHQLKQKLEHNPWVNTRPMVVTWRLTDDLDHELGLPAPPRDAPRIPLTDAIDQSDAVLTTPSTLYLESVIKGRPTALLDFHNVPHYVPSAWMINAPKHINQILSELGDPPAAKMLYQRMVLDDQLECRGPATGRMVALIEALVELGDRARAADAPLEIPPRLLEDPQQGFAAVTDGFDLQRLYPRNQVFPNQDLARAQVELNLANVAMADKLREVEELWREIELLKQNRAELMEHLQNIKKRLMATRTRLLAWKQKALQVRNQPTATEAAESAAEAIEVADDGIADFEEADRALEGNAELESRAGRGESVPRGEEDDGDPPPSPS